MGGRRLSECSEYVDFPCHDDNDGESCPVQNWCVHQCSFSKYLDEVGSCDAVKTDLVCDAVNIKTMMAFAKRSYVTKYSNALECIAEKCGVDENTMQQLRDMKGKCGSTVNNMYKIMSGRASELDDIEEEVNRDALFWGAGVAAVLGVGLLGALSFGNKKIFGGKSKMADEATYEAAEIVKPDDSTEAGSV